MYLSIEISLKRLEKSIFSFFYPIFFISLFLRNSPLWWFLFTNFSSSSFLSCSGNISSEKWVIFYDAASKILLSLFNLSKYSFFEISRIASRREAFVFFFAIWMLKSFFMFMHFAVAFSSTFFDYFWTLLLLLLVEDLSVSINILRLLKLLLGLWQISSKNSISSESLISAYFFLFSSLFLMNFFSFSSLLSDDPNLFTWLYFWAFWMIKLLNSCNLDC